MEAVGLIALNALGWGLAASLLRAGCGVYGYAIQVEATGRSVLGLSDGTWGRS